jgi:hypothetical protein
MKIRLEQDDVFQAVREFLTRQGMEVPEKASYEIDKDESGAIYIDIAGITRLAQPEPLPQRTVRQKPASAVVEAAERAVVASASPGRLAYDPGASPMEDAQAADEDLPDLDAIRRGNEELIRNSPQASPTPRRRRGGMTETRAIDPNDPDFDPTDFRDEI